MATIEDLEKISTQVRRDILRQVHQCQSGHPGGSLGCADLLTALYFHVLKHNSDFSMNGSGEDVFFLSNGHISAAWYSVLARSGYFPIEELASFRKLNTRLQGHPTTHEGLPGVRIASGSLGQGLSAAIGYALGKKLNGDRQLTYCLCGDGELQEGQVWEAALSAAHHKVDNLIGIVDLNGQQIDGPTSEVMALNNLDKKWSSFGWKIIKTDGNNMTELIDSLTDAKNVCFKGQPIMILMKTEMGKGVDFMEGTHHWHGKPPSDEQLENALLQLNETLGDYPIKA